MVDNLQQKPLKKSILGVFAKQPVAGQVKTRLCPPLSLGQAASLYTVSLQETVARMQAGSGYDLAICYAGEQHWFEEAFPEVTLVAQRGDDLGTRMANALAGFLVQGYRRAVLIGSDAPDLPLEMVDQAFVALSRFELVLGPAADGGYYLVGESVHHQELFEGIHWSTGTVLEETLARAHGAKVSTARLAGWEDLDDLPALRRFLERSPSSRTAGYLRAELDHCLVT